MLLKSSQVVPANDMDQFVPWECTILLYTTYLFVQSIFSLSSYHNMSNLTCQKMKEYPEPASLACQTK